jgi:hypothetical protein
LIWNFLFRGIIISGKMKFYKLNTYIIIFFVLLIPGFLLAEEAQKPIKLEWGAVENASGYAIEIRDDKEFILIQKRIKDNRLEVNLDYGNYSFRVGVLNKFDKIAVWSEWSGLDIKKPIVPRFKSLSHTVFTIKDQPKKLVLKGENLFQSTEILVKSDEKEIPIVKKQFIDTQTIEFYLDPSKAIPGYYTLFMENPGKKRSRENDVISILAPINSGMGDTGNNLLSVGFFPQYLSFQNNSYNSVLKMKQAFSLDFYLDRYSFLSIIPGFRMGYYSLLGSESINAELVGYRLDGFISYIFLKKYRLQIITTFGSGISSLRLNSRDASLNKKQISFVEMNTFASVDLRFRIFHFLSIMAGLEYLNLHDQKGNIAFFVPRAGITATF